MSEMVERVARAMCRANWPDEERWLRYRDTARAAIEAMREPTGTMLELVVPEPSHLYENRDEDYKKRMQVAVKVDRLVALQRHRAMINAALASDPKP